MDPLALPSDPITMSMSTLPRLSSHYQLTTTEVHRITQARPKFTCGFCGRMELDEIRLGPMYSRDGVTVHYFCMLFSSALCQNGSDGDGILGFLTPDIHKEIRRASRLKCAFCNETGASVGCCNKRCKDLFHFPCGLDQGCTFQFHGKYESFCSNHWEPRVPSPSQVLKTLLATGNPGGPTCTICTAPMSPIQDALISGSCCRGSVWHKDCIQKMALSAGYFFKCPLCNDRTEFVFQMKNSGIYVPEQDAAWERDNSYSELYISYSRCDATKCHCRFGREYSKPTGAWLIARCRLCGAAGTHKQCGGLKNGTASWACPPCFQVERNTIKSKTENLDHSSDLPGPSRLLLQGTTTTTADQADSSAFRWREVMISKRCYAYFPYSRQILKKLDPAVTLPDWRNLQLRVNLVDWIPRVGIAYQVPKVTTRSPSRPNPKQPDLNQHSPSQNPNNENLNPTATSRNDSNNNLGRATVPKHQNKKNKSRVRVSVSGNQLITNPSLVRARAQAQWNKMKRRSKYARHKKSKKTPAPAPSPDPNPLEAEPGAGLEQKQEPEEEETFSVNEVFKAYQSQILYQTHTADSPTFQFAEAITLDMQPSPAPSQSSDLPDPLASPLPSPSLPTGHDEQPPMNGIGIEIITIDTESSEAEETEDDDDEPDLMIIEDFSQPSTCTSPPRTPKPIVKILTPEQQVQFQAQSHRIRNEMEKGSSASPPSASVSPSLSLSPLQNQVGKPRERQRKQLFFPSPTSSEIELESSFPVAMASTTG